MAPAHVAAPAQSDSQKRARGAVSIREAQLADVPRLIEMGAAFLADSIYGQLFPNTPIERIDQIVGYVLAHGVAIVAETTPAEGARADLIGMIGLLPYEHPLSGGYCVEEVAWWVEPAARTARVGLELLAAAETWATRKGATLLKVAAPASSDVGRFLEHRDYQPAETAFVKVLG